MRMSSGASAAYEKPRSGRSSCIDETPRSSRIASARDAVRRELRRARSRTRRESSRIFSGARARRRSKYGATRRVAVDRDQLALAAQPLGEQAEWPPAPKVQSITVSPGLRREDGEHLVREDGDVVSLDWQDARQHPLRSLRPRAAACATSARSQISRWSPTPATVTSRPMPSRSSSSAGITTRPCLSSSPAVALAKKWRCMRARVAR